MTYIIFGILIILAIGFVAWALDEPAGGVISIILGVILYISGTHILGIICGIFGIWAYAHAKEEEKKANIAWEKNYRRKRLYEILEHCWNGNTCELDWDSWWDESDHIFYNESDQEIKKSAQSEFENMGKSQIRMINIYLGYLKDESRKDWAIREIKARQSIIYGLSSMFWQKEFYMKNSKLCNEVEAYKQDVCDYIIYGEKTLNQEKLSSMIKRGDDIYHGRV